MSALPGLRWCVHGLLLLGCVLTLPSVRADDFLDQKKRQDQLQAQRLEVTVSEALGQARTLERTDPARAAAVLRQCRSQLEEDRALPEARRGELLRQVSARLRTLQEDVRAREAKADAAAPAAEDPRQKYEKVIGKKYPSPADQAGDFIKGGQGQLSRAERLKLERERGVTGVLEDIDRSNVPVGDEGVRFPSNWRQLVAMRKQFTGPQLTAEEKSLMKAMNSVLSVDFDKMPFRDVLDYLSEKSGQSIVVDKATLEEANVQYDDPVTFSGKKVSFRTILRKVLADRGLAYILKEGTIQVVTPQRARDTMVVRSYPVGDLLPVLNPNMPAFVNQQQAFQAVTQIIQLIETSVEPSSWAVNGGPGTIFFNAPNMSLVIRQSAEMHYSLASGMFGR